MLRTKRIVLLLLVVSSFMFPSAWAAKKQQPQVFTINGYLRVYSGIASKIIKHIREENNGIEIQVKGLSITIPEDTPLLKRIIALYKKAKTPDVLGKKQHWVQDGNLGVRYNESTDLVDSITFR
jgi:hypothetical protein